MKVSRLLLLASAVLPLTAAATEAQEASRFAGAYAGIYGGHAKAEDKGNGYFQSDRFAPADTRSGYSQKVWPEGGVYGLKGGYNWVFNSNLLLGIELDYEGRSKNEDKDYQDFNGVSTEPLFGVETQLQQAGYVLGRAGYLFNDKGLVYVTGGYAAVEAKRTWSDNLLYTKESHKSWQDGWAAGAGIEYMLTENIAASLEYRYADYGSKDVDADLWGEYYKQKLTEQSWLVGAAWHF